MSAALAGWLVGFVFWGAVPIGALALGMMMRLIPGVWRSELQAPTDLAIRLLPIAALAALPVLLGADHLYPWSAAPQHGAFRAFYLSLPSFAARTVLFFAAMLVLGFLLPRTRRAVALSSAGLIAFVLLDTMMARDWLMSLDPHFHSSGFGLYVLSIQTTIALAVAMVLRLRGAASRTCPPVLGGLVLTALLLWAYFAFMQYLVLWSGNQPQAALWYAERSRGPWRAVAYAYGALQLGAAFALLFPPVRCSQRWLLALGAAVLAAKLLEVAWLVLPAFPEHTGAAALAAGAGLAGLGLLMLMPLRGRGPAHRQLARGSP